MRKKLTILLLTALVLLTACQRERVENRIQSNEFCLYYLNSDKNEIVAVEYTPKATSAQEIAEECIKKLQLSPDETQYSTPFGTGVVLLKTELGQNQMQIYFNEDYASLTTTTEVLTRAAIVRTLVQIPGIDCVSFYVDDAPLRDAKGNVVGIMTADTFVENVGRQINTIETKNIVLYYATKDGKSLVATERSVYTSSNTSSEKLVLQHLLESPSDSNLLRTIPEGTKLISVSTLNGVCFVNFDEGLLKYDYQVGDGAALYSIVNSLCELSGVNKVQISVNGKTDLMFRDAYSLEELYERNLDLVAVEGED